MLSHKVRGVSPKAGKGVCERFVKEVVLRCVASKLVGMCLVQVKEYHRLKEEAGKRAAAKLHELDTVSREQKLDQDRLDNEQRQKSDYDAHIKQKENELEESIQRLDKLNEYIRSVSPSVCLSDYHAAFISDVHQVRLSLCLSL